MKICQGRAESLAVGCAYVLVGAGHDPSMEGRPLMASAGLIDALAEL